MTKKARDVDGRVLDTSGSSRADNFAAMLGTMPHGSAEHHPQPQFTLIVAAKLSDLLRLVSRILDLCRSLFLRSLRGQPDR